MSDKMTCSTGDMVEAMRYALRDPNEGAEIDRIMRDFLFIGDEHSTDMARELLFEMLEHYKGAQ